MKFSANIGFLWDDLPLTERVRRAAANGFDAVECHFPYDTDPAELAAVLAECNLPLLSLNTALGANGQDDFGVTARPDRRDEARRLIDAALDYADVSGCRMVSVVPGRTARAEGAETTWRENLAYAAEKAAALGKTLLIEPINQRVVPGYHLSLLDDALATIDAVAAPNLKLMFDCFHTQIMEGDLRHNLERVLPVLGHVQMAAVHDRGEPDQGEIDYPWLLGELYAMGWEGHVGAEYRPRGASVEAGLGWLPAFRAA
ncbi:MAG: isomerase [Gammaproteobacteria bacterium]|nr:MAG: isomerase [Gammaproteobacteria bacterium]